MELHGRVSPPRLDDSEYRKRHDMAWIVKLPGHTRERLDSPETDG